MPAIGLYVHVPFCTRKCGYCDFYSTVARADQPPALVAALLTELDQAVIRPGHQAETIFVGGGTPTVLPQEQMQRLFEALGKLARGSRTHEFTVEANPATLDARKAALLAEAGVDRVSLGAQSFNPSELRVLDREHDPADVERSVAIARAAGIRRLNLDLIFGVPGQTLASWAESLDRALALAPEHLACYGLTYEPGTPLHRRRAVGRLRQADEDLEADLYLMTIDRLAAAGYEQYEISAYARPGGRCLHNLRYWRNLPGVGLGPSASGYLEGRRYRNVPDTAEYVRRVNAGQDAAAEWETLSPLERAGEAAMLGLRMTEGIEPAEFNGQTGFDLWSLYREVIQPHLEAGLLTVTGGRVALTRRGLLVADRIMADFLSPGR